MHDPSLHLKTIEDELKGTIGKALGKQGQKISLYSRLMHQERQKYGELLEKIKDLDNDNSTTTTADTAATVQQLRAIAKQHNLYRKECLQARWELIVHRQAVGFIVDNHKYVMETFPIGDALRVESATQGEQNESSVTKNVPSTMETTLTNTHPERRPLETNSIGGNA